MLLQLSENLPRLKHKMNDKHVYGIIILLTLLRVLSTNTRICLEGFDCNSYIDMLSTWWQPDANPGHHAMRVLPVLAAKMLQVLGLNVMQSFMIISSGAYIAYGVLTFWLLRLLDVNRLLAFSGTLLALSFHQGLKVSLVDPFQACDALVYPVVLLMFYATWQNKTFLLWGVSCLGVFIRQNIFIFTILCCIKQFTQTKDKKNIIALISVIILYAAFQHYYQATGTFVSLLSPPNGYFDFAYWSWVLVDSELLYILLPILPVLLFYWRGSVKFLTTNWHVLLYGCIVVGQPTLGYHLTGNNYPRLACQGAFWLAFMVPWVMHYAKVHKHTQFALLVYSLLLFSTWSFSARVVFISLFMLYQSYMVFKNKLTA